MDDSQPRLERSLAVLTEHFVRMLQHSPCGVLNLTLASNALPVRQKRRLYDIINVLEGIGLVEKKRKNFVQWRGPVAETSVVSSGIADLKEEIEQLKVREEQLDCEIKSAESDIGHLLTTSRTYVFHEDLCSYFKGQTIITINGPEGTVLSVPTPTKQDGETQYEMKLVSSDGPIDVMLVADNSISSPCYSPNQSSVPNDSVIKEPMHIAEDTDKPLNALPKVLEDKDASKNMSLFQGFYSDRCTIIPFSPPATKNDYICALEDYEGISDVFDLASFEESSNSLFSS